MPDVRFDGPLELLTLRPQSAPPDVQHHQERGAAQLFEKRVQIDEGPNDDGHREAQRDPGPLPGGAGRRLVGPARHLYRVGGERPAVSRLVQSVGKEMPGRRAATDHRSDEGLGRVFLVRVGNVRRSLEAGWNAGDAEGESGKDGAGLHQEAERHHGQSVGNRGAEEIEDFRPNVGPVA